MPMPPWPRMRSTRYFPARTAPGEVGLAAAFGGVTGAFDTGAPIITLPPGSGKRARRAAVSARAPRVCTARVHRACAERVRGALLCAGSGRRVDGQGHRERRAPALAGALGRDGAAVRLDQVAHEPEPDAEA